MLTACNVGKYFTRFSYFAVISRLKAREICFRSSLSEMFCKKRVLGDFA